MNRGLAGMQRMKADMAYVPEDLRRCAGGLTRTLGHCAMIDLLADGVLVHRDGVVRHANGAVAEMLG